METNKSIEKVPAKNITEMWLNNISEGLILLERFEKSFRSGVETLAELSDVFLRIIDRDLWQESFRECSLKVVEMFLSQAEIILTDCYGFIPEKDFNELKKDIEQYNQWLHAPDYLYYYAPYYSIHTGRHYTSVLQFTPRFKEFINLLVRLRLRFVKVLSPILFTNLNSSSRNIEM
jgi:hypothetical protein